MTNHFLKFSPNLLEDLYELKKYSGINDSLENLQNMLNTIVEITDT